MSITQEKGRQLILAAFRCLLPVLRIYNICDVNYKFPVLTGNIGRRSLFYACALPTEASRNDRHTPLLACVIIYDREFVTNKLHYIYLLVTWKRVTFPRWNIHARNTDLFNLIINTTVHLVEMHFSSHGLTLILLTWTISRCNTITEWRISIYQCYHFEISRSINQ